MITKVKKYKFETVNNIHKNNISFIENKLIKKELFLWLNNKLLLNEKIPNFNPIVITSEIINLSKAIVNSHIHNNIKEIYYNDNLFWKESLILIENIIHDNIESNVKYKCSSELSSCKTILLSTIIACKILQ